MYISLFFFFEAQKEVLDTAVDKTSPKMHTFTITVQFRGSLQMNGENPHLKTADIVPSPDRWGLKTERF